MVVKVLFLAMSCLYLTQKRDGSDTVSTEGGFHPSPILEKLDYKRVTRNLQLFFY